MPKWETNLNSCREWFGKFRSVKTQSNLHLFVFFSRKKNFLLSLYLFFHLTSIHFIAIRVSSILKVWNFPTSNCQICDSFFSILSWWMICFANDELFFQTIQKLYFNNSTAKLCYPESTDKISLKLDEYAWFMQYIILVW